MEKNVNENGNMLLTQAIDIGYIDLNEASFFENDGGFVGMTYKSDTFPRVVLRRALPVNHPDEYISISKPDNFEIGIIRDIRLLNNAQLKIVSDELDRRYYCPKIEKIQSVKDKMGFVYFDLLIRRKDKIYPKTCSVKDVSKNIRMLGADKLIIFDTEGNRFIIDPLSALDKKSLKQLEPYLF